MIPWKVLASVSTNGHELQLRQRGPTDFLIMVDGRVLMTSNEKTSELALATLACAEITDRKSPRLMIGGLGMAYTLRAALDALPRTARVTVAELTPEIETWCRGPLASLTKNATNDPRVSVVIQDVSLVIERAKPGSYDAIVLDLYEGPHGTQRRENDPFYGRVALERTYRALSPGGVFAVWSEEGNAIFKRRMTDAGFDTKVHHPGGPRAYVVYLGTRAGEATAPAPRSRARGARRG